MFDTKMISTIPKTRKHIKVELEPQLTLEDLGKKNESVPNSPSEKQGPLNWERLYANILEMRKDLSAPVDTMGCERAHDAAAEPKVQRFQCLVSLMLSSQTKDEVNFAAMTRLKDHGLTVENLLQTNDDKLGKLIYPVGFWKNKVKFLKK